MIIIFFGCVQYIIDFCVIFRGENYSNLDFLLCFFCLQELECENVIDFQFFEKLDVKIYMYFYCMVQVFKINDRERFV